MTDRPTIICITPIKNEAWILDKFLSAASLWADKIIIADQNSTDDSCQIAARFPKVTVINNPGKYDEFERTKLMFQEVRKIQGKKLVLALDADEFLSANYMDSPEWSQVLSLPKGSIVQIERVNLAPGLRQYFGLLNMVIGLMDDDTTTIDATSKANIHNIRLPWPPDANVVKLKDIKVLHYDAVDYRRVTSKLRWYQAFERTVNKKEFLDLLKKYKIYTDEKEFLSTVTLQDVKPEWFDNYLRHGLDMHQLNNVTYWWDDEVLSYLDKNGTAKYKLLDIWGKDWAAEATKRGLPDPDRFRPDLSPLDKYVRRYWKNNIRRNHYGNGLINRILKIAGYK